MRHTELWYVLSLTVLGLLAWSPWSDAETPGTQRLTIAASAGTGADTDQGQFMGPMKVTGSATVVQVRQQGFAPKAGAGGVAHPLWGNADLCLRPAAGLSRRGRHAARAGLVEHAC